jgi:hypothetical protein
VSGASPGAILFSDILVVPDALGRKVSFAEGEGPRLDPIDDAAGVASLRTSVDLESWRARDGGIEPRLAARGRATCLGSSSGSPSLCSRAGRVVLSPKSSLVAG